MSLMIKDCADQLVFKFDGIAKSEGKIDAKAMTIENLGAKDDPFIRNAKVVFSPPANKRPLILILYIFPKLLRIIGERMFVLKEF